MVAGGKFETNWLLYFVISAPSCSDSEMLIGGEFCVTCYDGEKASDDMKGWCDSYKNKELFVPTRDDLSTDLQNLIYEGCGEFGITIFKLIYSITSNGLKYHIQILILIIFLIPIIFLIIIQDIIVNFK